jgi:hypothetical protein
MKARYSSLHTAEQLRKFHLASLLPGEFPPHVKHTTKCVETEETGKENFRAKKLDINYTALGRGKTHL